MWLIVYRQTVFSNCNYLNSTVTTPISARNQKLSLPVSLFNCCGCFALEDMTTYGVSHRTPQTYALLRVLCYGRYVRSNDL